MRAIRASRRRSSRPWSAGSPRNSASAPDAIARMREMFLQTQVDGFVGCCEAIRNMDLRDTHARISAPTLVIVGRRDPATPPEAGKEIQARVKGAKLAELDAAHISNIEQPQAYTDAVLRFLQA